MEQRAQTEQNPGSSTTSKPELSPPSEWVLRWAHLIPKSTAPETSSAQVHQSAEILDLACGQGRHMKWLFESGRKVLGIDNDPVCVEACRAFGQVLQCDLESLQPPLQSATKGANWPLEGQVFNGIIVTNYLWRPLWPNILQSLAENGVLIYETFSAGQETLGRPRRPEFLLKTGELLQICVNMRVIAFEEVFLERPDRCIQRIVAARAQKEVVPARLYRATSR